MFKKELINQNIYTRYVLIFIYNKKWFPCYKLNILNIFKSSAQCLEALSNNLISPIELFVFIVFYMNL